MTLPIPFRVASILPNLAVRRLHKTTVSPLRNPPRRAGTPALQYNVHGQWRRERQPAPLRRGRRTWRMADSYLSSPARGGFVGRAFSPAAWGLPPPQGFRDDASTAARRWRFGAQSTKCRLLARRSSPTKHRARLCRAIFTARWQCTLPSAPFGASTSPCRGGFANGFHPKGSPAREAVGVSRLRGAAHDLANTLPGCLKPPRRAFTPALQYNVYVQRCREWQPAPLRRGRCSHRPADGHSKGLPLSYHLPFPAAM